MTNQEAGGTSSGDLAPAALDLTRPRFTSYAQNFEDVMLWRALKHVDDGFYVDVGAHDPVLDSVSKAFYDEGWSGFDVEPVAREAELLRADRPRNRVFECAVGEEAGHESLYVFEGSGLSTKFAGQADRHMASLGLAFTEQDVEVRTLRDILECAGDRAIHWMKIDVEGAEAEVLRSWRGSVIQPWVVVVEATLPNENRPSHEEWEFILVEAGYEFVYFDGLNRFYVAPTHGELRAAFRVPPNVFDHFVLAQVSRLERSRDEAHTYVRSLEAELNQHRTALDDLHESIAAQSVETTTYIASLEAELDRNRSGLDDLQRNSAKQSADAAIYIESLRAELARHQEELVRAGEAQAQQALAMDAYTASLTAELHARAERLQVVERARVEQEAGIRLMVEEHERDRLAWRADVEASAMRIQELAVNIAALEQRAEQHDVAMIEQARLQAELRRDVASWIRRARKQLNTWREHTRTFGRLIEVAESAHPAFDGIGLGNAQHFESVAESVCEHHARLLVAVAARLDALKAIQPRRRLSR